MLSWQLRWQLSECQYTPLNAVRAPPQWAQFTTGKQVAQFVTATSKKLMQLTSPSFPGWNVTIDGLVARPMNLSLDEVLGMVQVEQRVYRHR